METTIAAALGPPVEARALLAEKLIESLDSEPAPGLSAEWTEEIRRRCREIDEARVGLLDAQAVLEQGYALLG
ncbi:MAG TPA: addiction module protein [Candidatus Hydrogenedentes bacterium]|nr:addiction module protein [Candidatus Hydrogenedentota bacterium]HPC16872.1 addiction module protein [Candidatus Hydrogenedentota bacterium]HRT20697.1 addiction module protein [Candidatus Hydrogenedentota bacterium]HRT66183.1 addiction module protein [Candidatus Hydrogenedentota bacterium]